MVTIILIHLEQFYGFHSLNTHCGYLSYTTNESIISMLIKPDDAGILNLIRFLPIHFVLTSCKLEISLSSPAPELSDGKDYQMVDKEPRSMAPSL